MERRKDPSPVTDLGTRPEPGPSRGEPSRHPTTTSSRPVFSRDSAGRGQLPSATLPRERLVHGLRTRGPDTPASQAPPLFRKRLACLALPWSYRAAQNAAGSPGNPGAPNPTRVVAARAGAMVSNPVHGLPFLPGTSFKDLTVRTSPAKPLSPPPGSLGELSAGCVSARPREFVRFPFKPSLCPQLCSPHPHPRTHPHCLSPVCSQPIPLWFFHSILAVCWPPSVLPCCSALAGFPHLVPELPRPSP